MKIFTTKKTTAKNFGFLLLFLVGCIMVVKLHNMRNRLQLKYMSKVMAVKVDDDYTDKHDEANVSLGDEWQRITSLRRTIRKNKMQEKEASRALQEEALMDLWARQVGMYRCTAYDEAEDKTATQSLKEALEMRQNKLDQTFEKIKEYLAHADLSKLSQYEKDALLKYEVFWKAWIDGAYSNKNGIDEKMELFLTLKRQEAVIQDILIRNLDNIHQSPVAAYTDLIEKAQDAFHPLHVNRGYYSKIIEDPDYPGHFCRLFVRF